ncbi:retrovirus-related Pol polyprotein from type-1 retrotransposable element R2 [Trichonephila clavipes]|nr:retrovirus-related Pol polyprotein from type-1 retrotransposable element R2 [Trichonephila clavipes]
MDSLCEEFAAACMTKPNRSRGQLNRRRTHGRRDRASSPSSSITPSNGRSATENLRNALRSILHAGVFAERKMSTEFPFIVYPDPVASDLLTRSLVPGEVWDKLSGLADTVPELDDVRYSNLKSRDSGAFVLSTIFNRIFELESVSLCWKTSKVALIYKKGDRDDIFNWRPVSLLNTTGKIFSSVVAGHLSSWSSINDRIDWHQKGFRENEGCVEHNFVLDQAIVQAKHSKKDLSLAWLDLENAFGALLHEFIFRSLISAGVPNLICSIITSMYSNASSSIRCEDIWTSSIPMSAGVRQGCPLSAILFNLSLEQILRHSVNSSFKFISLSDHHLKYLAYADDLVILAPTFDYLQSRLDSLTTLTDRVGLKFKPSKCAAMSFSLSGGCSLRRLGSRAYCWTPYPYVSRSRCI